MTHEEESSALRYDPWGERDATFVTLSDKFIVTRKPSECAICFCEIPVGSRVRAKREADNGKAATFRFCVECCTLMAHRNDELSDDDIETGIDNFDRLMQRYNMSRSDAEPPK